MNGDIALRPSEVDPSIAAIIRDGLSFQAEHQHFYDFEPMVWFVHVRGTTDPVGLASAIYQALRPTTSTPSPRRRRAIRSRRSTSASSRASSTASTLARRRRRRRRRAAPQGAAYACSRSCRCRRWGTTV
jgi:hypothetical protein